MSFCSLTKGITPKICRLCVCVLINEHSFEPVMCLARTAVDAKRVYTNTNVLFSMSIFERGSDVKQWYRNTNNRLSTVNQQTIELITALLTSNRHNDKDRSRLRQLSSDIRVNARHTKSARGTSSKQSSGASES